MLAVLIYIFEILRYFICVRNMNYSIAIVHPKLPYIKWKNEYSTDGEYSSEYYLVHHSISILIPFFDVLTVKNAKRSINDIWQDIFEEELRSWYIEESLRPRERTQKFFWLWFGVEFRYDAFDSQMVGLTLY